MTSSQLEIFLCVARTLNFTKAAAEYHTTQPTISRQISLLEEEWGFSLFIRNNKEVRLTPAGAIMVQKVQEANACIDEGISRIMSINESLQGSLTIGCLDGMDSDFFVAPTVSSFGKKYPEILINLEKRSFSELRQRLQEGILDVIFTLDFEAENFTDIVYNKYYPVATGLVTARSHPLSSLSEIVPERFSGQTFIVPPPDESPKRAEELKKILNRLGIRNYHLLFANNQESMLLNVRAGKGIAIMDTSVRSVLDTDFYHFFEISKENAPLSIVYLWKKQNLNPAAALYVSSLMEQEFIDVFNN